VDDDELKRAFEDTRRHFDVVAERLDSKIDGVAERLDSKVDGAVEGLRRENAAEHETTRRYFDSVAERLESRMNAIGDGVDLCNQRIDKLDQKFDQRMTAEFAEMRSMFKFSHHDLDRRLRTLEETVSDLQSRVERLESSTH
jgi:predicted  nucleic acid-binding Zn-ribbon protein